MDKISIEQAKQVLEKEGYHVDSLLTVDEVKVKFKCTDEQAHAVLFKALNNEATLNQIHYSIGEFGEMDGLESK